MDAGSERVLLDRIPSPSRYHIGGDVQFGKDGFLYVSVGDGLCHHAIRRTEFGPGGCTGHSGLRNPAAREPDVLLGKILRVDRFGRAPGRQRRRRALRALGPDAAPAARCREIFASGLRNPFRMAFDEGAEGTRFFVNDVGEENWEEVNVGRLGADYGWNRREGRCPAGRARGCGPAPEGLTDPLFTYHQSAGRPDGPRQRGCEAITGGAFVPRGGLVRAVRPRLPLRRLRLREDHPPRARGRLPHARTRWSPGWGPAAPSTCASGPGRSAPRSTSRRSATAARCGGSTTCPATAGRVAAATATPAFGALPLTTTLDGRASSDPDGDRARVPLGLRRRDGVARRGSRS